MRGRVCVCVCVIERERERERDMEREKERVPVSICVSAFSQTYICAWTKNLSPCNGSDVRLAMFLSVLRLACRKKRG